MPDNISKINYGIMFGDNATVNNCAVIGPSIKRAKPALHATGATCDTIIQLHLTKSSA